MRQKIHFPLGVLAAVLLVAVAALAGLGLWALHRAHGQVARLAATRTVLSQTRLIGEYLSRHPAVRGEGTEADWDLLSSAMRSLHTVEPGLQYVSVRADDMILFHEQTSDIGTEPPPSRPPALAELPPDMPLKRKLLRVGNRDLPVVVLAVPVQGEDGTVRTVEIGLRADTVGREEHDSIQALSSMYRLSLATLLASFAICVALVTWILHREAHRQRQRRREEHLAFSGVLANGIVHDFRNPMSALRLDVQMLERGLAKTETEDADRLSALAGRIRNTLDRMDKVFQEFLYLSKPPSRELESTDLVRCVRDSLDMLTPKFEHSEVRAELEAPEALNVLAYPASLRRAVINVLTNSEQFSPPGATIDVHITHDSRVAVLDIMDRGAGIPKSQKKQVFDMFVSSRPEGTGLGLFLARTAIERGGGTITVEDRPGGGSVFRISLPLAHPDMKAGDTP